MIQLEKSRSGAFTLKYNDKYIHSKYDPIKESQQFVNTNIDIIKDKSNIVVYGIGIGYHINEIINNMNQESTLYIFELNDILVEYCKEINPNIFKHKNIIIFHGQNETFYNKLAQTLDLVEDFIIHKASLETIKDINEHFYNLIYDYSDLKKAKHDEDLNELLEDNFNENMKYNYPIINEFINQYSNSNKPFIVTAAGPSLDFELQLVKAYRDKFNIISVGSSLRALMNNGIKPDAIVILDGKEVVRKQFIGYENECIPLCFAASASRWAVNVYNGPKYIFNTEGDNETTIKTRGTVAVSAIDIAVKCNAEQIILFGQDLAFIDGKSHTESFEKVYGFKDNVKEHHKNVTVQGVEGTLLPTTRGYIMFKNKIESLIAENKNIKFINCSKGAHIKGTTYMTFFEYINNKKIK